MLRRAIVLAVSFAVVLAIGGSAHASNPDGRGGTMPAY